MPPATKSQASGSPLQDPALTRTWDYRREIQYRTARTDAADHDGSSNGTAPQL